MQDSELVFQHVIADARRRERQPVGVVFVFVPARSEPDVDPAAAHMVDLGDDHREGPHGPERGRRHQSAEPDRTGVPSQAGEGRPGVGVSG